MIIAVEVKRLCVQKIVTRLEFEIDADFHQSDQMSYRVYLLRRLLIWYGQERPGLRIVTRPA